MQKPPYASEKGSNLTPCSMSFAPYRYCFRYLKRIGTSRFDYKYEDATGTEEREFWECQTDLKFESRTCTQTRSPAYSDLKVRSTAIVLWPKIRKVI